MNDALYRTLYAEAQTITDNATHWAVLDLICSGDNNAEATINDDKAATREDYPRLLKGSIGCLLSDGSHTEAVEAWFAARNIKA